MTAEVSGAQKETPESGDSGLPWIVVRRKVAKFARLLSPATSLRAFRATDEIYLSGHRDFPGLTLSFCWTSPTLLSFTGRAW